VFDALNAGAVDFVTKPDLSTQRGFDFLINELIIKIKIASMAKVGHWKKEYADLKTIGSMNREASSKSLLLVPPPEGPRRYTICSERFRGTSRYCYCSAHAPVFTRMYAERLNNSCLMEVKEAQTGDRVCQGRVLIAPGIIT